MIPARDAGPGGCGPLPVELVFSSDFERGDTSGWRLTLP